MLAGAVFPWRSDNRFRLLVDGPQFFPAMIEAIERAERRIDLELYLVEDGYCLERMLEPLLRAAERGVRVRCLFDGFGCLKMSQANRDRMTAAGVELRLYNPLSLRLKLRNLHRDHRKLLLVDGCVGFVGGTGITDDFWNPRKPAVHWHEVMVEMFGPLLQDWQALFDSQWVHCLKRRIWQLPLPSRAPRIPHVPEGLGLGRVAYAAARQHRDILLSLLRNLRRAQNRIWLATPYFLPTGKVRRALIRAARRGVD
ncbi:MAG TPA: cardiolipin synthase B, partial [Pseudomonas sp.]|nr:cardiolipin synthase B [Pseudomonas sp.]